MFINKIYNNDCGSRPEGDAQVMAPKTFRRGIWVPRACIIPLMVLCLIIFIADTCSRR